MSVLPMWRSPTPTGSIRSNSNSSSGSSSRSSSSTPARRRGSGFRHEVSWEDDDDADDASVVYSSCGMPKNSPTRTTECLNFLSQVERVHIYESPHNKCRRDPVFVLDVYLLDVDDDGDDNSEAFMSRPTFQIERRLSEFADLRDQIIYWTSLCHLHHYTTTVIGRATTPATTTHKHSTHNSAVCTHCSVFQARRAAWEPYWPGSFLSRLFQSRAKSEFPLQSMVNDVLELTRSPFSDAEDAWKVATAVAAERCTALQQLPALLTSFLVRHELSMDE